MGYYHDFILNPKPDRAYQTRGQPEMPSGTHNAGIMKLDGHIFMLVPWCVYCARQGHQEPGCPSKAQGRPPEVRRPDAAIWCSICRKKDLGHDESKCPSKTSAVPQENHNPDKIPPCRVCNLKNHTTEEHRYDYKNRQERINALTDQIGQSGLPAPIATGVDYPMPEGHANLPMRPVVRGPVDPAAKKKKPGAKDSYLELTGQQPPQPSFKKPHPRAFGKPPPKAFGKFPPKPALKQPSKPADRVVAKPAANIPKGPFRQRPGRPVPTKPLHQQGQARRIGVSVHKPARPADTGEGNWRNLPDVIEIDESGQASTPKPTEPSGTEWEDVPASNMNDEEDDLLSFD